MQHRPRIETRLCCSDLPPGPRHSDPQRACPHDAAHRGLQHDGLPVDPDRNLVRIGVDHDLVGGALHHCVAAGAVDELDRLRRALDSHRDHAEDPAVESWATPETDQVVEEVRVVADQNRLRVTGDEFAVDEITAGENARPAEPPTG